MSSISAQVQVCQMPRSFCRIAGRAPYKLALRTNSLGNVSAGAAAIVATACSSHTAALVWGAASLPPPRLRAFFLPRYENTDAGWSSLGQIDIWSQRVAKLFRRLEKWRGA